MLKELIYFLFTDFRKSKKLNFIGLPNVGDEIDSQKSGIGLRITQITPRIEAEVISAIPFWTEGIHTDNPIIRRGYVIVGETITFEPRFAPDGKEIVYYKIKETKHSPQFGNYPSRFPPMFHLGKANDGKWYFDE